MNPKDIDPKVEGAERTVRLILAIVSVLFFLSALLVALMYFTTPDSAVENAPALSNEGLAVQPSPSEQVHAEADQ